MAQGRRVRLVIRRIEPLTVLRVSVLFWASIYVILLVAALMLWSAATATGLRENVESFVGDLIAADDFSFKPAQMLRASVAGGAVLVALGSFATVMMAVLYNLISDVVGGVAVVFEETAGKAAERRAARKGTKAAPAGRPAKPGAAAPAKPARLGQIGARIAAKAAEARDARDARAMDALEADATGSKDGTGSTDGKGPAHGPADRPTRASRSQR